MTTTSWPKLWAICTVGEQLFSVDERINPQTEPDREFFYVGLEHIESSTGRLLEVPFVHGREIKSTKNVFLPGDILYGKLRPYLNKVYLAEKAGICSTDLLVFRPTSTIDAEYAAYFLRSEYVLQQTSQMATGANLPRVSRSDFERLPIPLPPLPEQQRIVAILRQADELRQLRREASKKSAQLLSRFFGEMFGKPEKNWPERRLGEIIAQLQPGKSMQAKPHPAVAGKWGVLKISAVTSGKFLPEENKELPEDVSPNLGYEVHDGDLLISRANTEELVGASAIATNCPRKLLLPDKLWRVVLPPDPPVNIPFLYALLNSPEMREQISRAASGTGGSMKNIAQEKFLNIRAKIPPKPLQNKFAERFQVLQENVIGNQETAAANIAAIWESLLSQAFTGELTAAWRNKHKTKLATAAKERDRALQQAMVKLRPTAVAASLDTEISETSPVLQIDGERLAGKPSTPSLDLLPFDAPGVPELSAGKTESVQQIDETATMDFGTLAAISPAQKNMLMAAIATRGYFTAESLRERVQALAIDPNTDAVAVRRGLEVLAAAGLLLPVSLAAQTPETGEFYFTAYRALRPEDDGHADRSALEAA